MPSTTRRERRRRLLPSAHPHPVVVAADVEDTTSHVAGADVPLSDVASFHVGDDLAWYATQELGPLLDELGV
ncbi:MAG: hypothetical protein WKF83_13150 [Nocardioidaceae bacterium]